MVSSTKERDDDGFDHDESDTAEESDSSPPQVWSIRSRRSSRTTEAQAISVTQPNPFDEIPGTTIFDAQRSRQGYHLNMFCMSLMKGEPNGVSSAVLVYTYRSARTLSH